MPWAPLWSANTKVTTLEIIFTIMDKDTFPSSPRYHEMLLIIWVGGSQACFYVWGAMTSEYTTSSGRPQSAIFQPIGPSYQARLLPAANARTRSLSGALAKIIAIEFFAVALSAYLASFLYHYFGTNAWPPAYHVPAAFFIAALVLLVSTALHHFEAIQTQPRHRFLWSGAGAVALAFSLFLTTMFLFKFDYSRGSFIFQILTVGIAMVGARAVVYSWLQSAIATGLLAARRVVLIGDDILCSQFDHRLKTTGILTVGSFHFPGDKELTSNETRPSVRGILDLCRAKQPDDVIILADQENFSKLPSLTNKLSELPINVHVVPRDSVDLLATARIAEFGNMSTFQVSSPPLNTFDLLIKRTFDVVAATVGLVLFSPLFLCVALAIKLDTRGPVFFRQTRHGYNNQTIRILKFRSLTTLENGNEFRQVRRNDSRITRVGGILRKTNIDELPQLINVLLGQMSIVGPRPHATAHNDMFAGRILPFARRHNVKPGITGWAQVNGCRGATDTLEKMQERIEFDLYYIDNWSFLFDAKIILMTFFSKKSYLNAY
jgi:Undecaprenyl-phosphate glucose phosphotransferase